MKQPDELFTNPQMDLTGLPEADHMEMIPLQPEYKTMRYISGAIVAAVMILICWPVVLIEPMFSPYGYVVATFVTLLAGWIILYNGFSFHYMAYAVREKDISFKAGWLWKSMTTVPYNRIQHCDIRQGILDRRFGLAKLTIYTAGGQSTDLMIPGLQLETAEKLKSFILKSTEQSIENT